MQTNARYAVIVVALTLLLPLFTVPAHAQFNAGIQGVITDPNGAVVPDASITLTSQETGNSKNIKSAGDGVYSLTGLAPGRYTLSVEKAGFTKKVLSEVLVTAETMQSVNVQLEVGQTTTSVTVEAPVAPVIDTETAMISGTLTSKDVVDLPAFGRDPYELLRLAPGTFGDAALTNGGGAAMMPGNNIGAAGATDSIFKVENGAQFVANGTRQNSNNFQIDGVPVNSASWGGAAVITPSEESVKEVRVVSNNYTAENGRTSGAQVEVVSQSGTNNYHGSAFFKWHRPGLNAYQAWNGPGNPSPVQKDENRFNQYGGSLGGPIWKNKVFAFFSYETLRNNSVSVATGWYETSQFLQNAGPSGSIARQLLSYPGEGPSYTKAIQLTCAQAGLPSTQCHDTSSGGLDLGSPLTSSLGTADPTYGQPGTPYGIGNGFDGVADVQYLQTVSPLINTSNQYNGRLDYQATSRDLISFSIYWVPLYNFSYNGPTRAANRWNHNSLAQSWTGIWSHTFTPTLINEARFGASGWKWNEITSNSQEPFGLPTDNIDSMGTVGVQYFGAPGPSVFNQLTYVYRDTLTKVHGSHTIKMGFDNTHATFLDEAPWSARPSYNFRNLWDFANDAPYQESANFNPVTGQPTEAQKNLRYNTIAFFVQDDWKVRPGLTLNLGLRWEDFTPLTETNGNITNVLLGPAGDPLGGLRLKKGGDLYHNYLNNWGPQIGFAWTPGKSSNLVVRGGFGIGYNLEQLAITSNGRSNPPFLSSFTLFGSNILYQIPGSATQFTGWPSNPATIETFDPSTGLPTSGAPVSLTGFPLNFHPAETYRYSLDMQYSLGHNWMATIGYSGSQTRHYTRQTLLNYLYYPNENPMANTVDWYSNDANAHYNALLAEITHRFSNTFEVDAQYRLSRNIDDGTQDYFEDMYPWNRAYSYGPSDFDVTHNVKLWGLYTPVFFKGRHDWVDKVLGGWTISGIVNFHTGFPWTPQYCNTGGNVVYPNSGYGCLFPATYSGGAGANYSNSTFMQPNGNFPQGALAYFTVPTWPTTGIPPAPSSNIHRNMFRGPNYLGNDFQLAKAFGLPGNRVLGEHPNLNLQANFYNLFNKLNLMNINNTISNDGTTSNPSFGEAQGAFAGRIIELQARFSF